MNQPGQKLPAPVPWSRRLSALLASAGRGLFGPKVALCRVAGPEKSSGLPLVIWCGARKQDKNLLLGLMFDGAPQERALGKTGLRKILQARPTGPDCSLIVLETKKPRPEWANGGHWFFIPGWVIGEIKLPLSEKLLRGDSVRNDLRKIRQNGFEFKIARGGKPFRDFYRNMHVPFIRRAHGPTAVFDPIAEYRRLVTKYDLLLVGRKDSSAPPVGGALIVHERTGPRLSSFGVRDGDVALARGGLIAAMYHFSFQHLLANGFTSVHTGRSRAFLNDGVLRYKRKLSNTITGGFWKSYSPGFALKIVSDTAATRSFLQNNPFISEADDGTLHGAVFTDAARPLPRELIQQLHKDYFYPGLSQLVIYCFQPEPPASPDHVPAALTGNVIIRSAADVIGA